MFNAYQSFVKNAIAY